MSLNASAVVLANYQHPTIPTLSVVELLDPATDTDFWVILPTTDSVDMKRGHTVTVAITGTTPPPVPVPPGPNPIPPPANVIAGLRMSPQ